MHLMTIPLASLSLNVYLSRADLPPTTLNAIVEITTLVNTYTQGVDAPNYAPFYDIFTPNVTVNHASARFGTTPSHGIPAFIESLQSVRQTQNYTCMHHLGSQSINVTSPDTASAVIYSIATFFGHGDREGQIFTNYEYFEDSLMYDGVSWKVFNRTLVTLELLEPRASWALSNSRG